MISDEEKLLVKHLYAYKNTNEFKKDMDYLLKHYAPVDLFDILDFVKYGRPLPEAAFLLTFDDGFRDNLSENTKTNETIILHKTKIKLSVPNSQSRKNIDRLH